MACLLESLMMTELNTLWNTKRPRMCSINCTWYNKKLSIARIWEECILPKDGYGTGTLKKNLIERLDKLENNEPTSTAVTKAIQFYIDTYFTQTDMEQSPLGYRGLDGTKKLITTALMSK